MKYIKNTIIVLLFVSLNIPNAIMAGATTELNLKFLVGWLMSSFIVVFLFAILSCEFNMWFDKQIKQ